MGLMYDVVDKELHGFCDELFGSVGIRCDFMNNSHTGGYNYTNNIVYVGYQNIYDSQFSGVVNPVDYVSVYKQCYHEYRHWVQHNKIFTGKDACGLPDNLVRLMAEQSMISDVFTNYGSPKIVSHNYLRLSYEIDAEEYALGMVQEKLSDGFSKFDLNDYICESVNQRGGFWWGQSPIYSVDAAIDDLHSRKLSCQHLVLCDEVNLLQVNHFSLMFMKNSKLLQDYYNLPASEQNKYLIQYICKGGDMISKHYPVIADEFPDSVSQQVEEQSKQKSSRLSGLKDVFGKITGLYDDVPDVQNKNSVSRQLPDIKYSDDEYDDIGFGV